MKGEEIPEKFEEECLKEREIELEPGSKRLKSKTKRKRRAKIYENQSKYHLKGAENLLGSDTPLLAIKEGYYAMLHKANQALALTGFDLESHVCAIIGVSRILKESELASKLQRAKDRREMTDYNINPSSYSGSVDPEKFVKEEVRGFIEEINKIIEDLKAEL